MGERSAVKGAVNISAFLLGLEHILAPRAVSLINLNTLTLDILRLLLVPIGSMFYFSQSILGQWPKTPIKNFSLMIASPMGV